MASTLKIQRLLTAAVAGFAFTFGGCENLANVPKNLGDYLNLRNSFLDPSQVGRFDKGSPWGTAKPVTWPILDQLDVIDEPNDRWSTAAEPQPSDLVVNTREYTVGEGDIVRISIFELVTPGLEYFKEAQVNELGNVTIQNLNQVHIAGLTPTQIEEKIAQAAVEKGFLLAKGNGNPGPQVSVTLLQSRSRVFSVLGQAGAPGTYNIIGTNFRLLDALALVHDVSGGTQPGMDYLYVIRPVEGAGVIPATQPSETGTPSPARNPLDTMDTIEKAPKTAPSTAPGAQGPAFLRPLPTAADMASPTQLAQADLDAALGGTKAATSPGAGTAPPVSPASDAASAPSATSPASGENMLNQAVGEKPGYIFVDGKWVMVNPTQPIPIQPGMSPTETVAAADGLSAPRVIRIPINQLKEGNPKYNIVIRPGDVINVPNIEPGEFYLMGHVARAGVYSLTGRKVTLKQAVAAAGGLDQLAIPRRCELIRRIGINQEVTVQVDLQRIFDGQQPDLFLKSNDIVNVGTDLLAPFLSVTRNAYRASYGWGFVYDRNLYNQVNLTQAVPTATPTP